MHLLHKSLSMFIFIFDKNSMILNLTESIWILDKIFEII